MQKFIKNKQLQKKIYLSLFLIAIFRIVSFIPVPFVNKDILKSISNDGIMSYLNMFSGGTLSNFTFMATGISSYISASIVMQLLTYGIKRFHDISKSPGGDRIIKKMTIIIGIVASFIISFLTTTGMQKKYGLLTIGASYVYFIIAAIHSLGTAFAIWIGETITNKGFGNGVSLLILINILSSIPKNIVLIQSQLKYGLLSTSNFILAIFIMLLVSLSIVVFEKSERRIKIKYSKLVARGKTSFGENSGYFPIKLNLSGVMPIIFASTFMQFFIFIGEAIKGPIGDFLKNNFSYGQLLNSFIMAALIFFFSYFYNALIFNPIEISNNIQNNGGIIPGVRPGLATGEYISKINKNLVFCGSIYLAIIALIPNIIFAKINFNGLSATSLMIIIGVGIEISEKIKLELDTGVFENF